MSDPYQPELPSAWAAYLPLITSLVRHLLGILGGAGFTWALTVNADQLQMAVSAAMMAAAAIWSFYQKIQSMRAARKAAAQSAIRSADATQKAGEPVAVIVQPKAAV